MTTTTAVPATAARLHSTLRALADAIGPELLADAEAALQDLTTELAYFERDATDNADRELLLDLSAAWLADRPDPERSAS